MNFGLVSVVRGLPALIGVFAGIFLYAVPLGGRSFALPAVVLIFIFVFLPVSRELFLRFPRFGLLLMEPWTISAMAIVALCSQFLIWLTVNLDGVLPNPTSPESKAVSGALLGAATAFLATAWTKDVQDSKGPFLASTVFQNYLARSFVKHHHLTGLVLELEACDSENVPGTDIAGWGLKARWKRAAILSKFLANGKKPTPLG